MKRVIKKCGKKGPQTVWVKDSDPRPGLPMARGHGRPPGSPTIRTAAVARELTRDQLTPLHIMASNMRFFYAEVERLTGIYNDLTDTNRAGEYGVAVYRAIRGNRLICQQVAVEAAPYMHAKLSNVNPESSDKRTIIVHLGNDFPKKKK